MQGLDKKAEQIPTSYKFQDLIQDLQKGDFGMKDLIEYGIVLYGQTRDGKTTSAQLICGNPVKGIKFNGKEMVITVTTRNSKAKIGNTTNSQTGVPNFLAVQVQVTVTIQNKQKKQKKKAYLVDTPGFGDNLGILRILGNGYYHYKLYSKVQNMKFILCFDVQSISSKIKQFIDTIVQFTSNFRDYHSHRKDIWKSCVFLFTKVEQNQNCIEDLRNKLKSILNQTKIEQQPSAVIDIKEFISYILEQDRLFYIKKYRPSETGTRGELLEQIDKKVSTWWKRQVSKERPDEVDMSPVVFSITRPILVQLARSDKSKKEFIQVMNYYNDRINQIFASIEGNSKSQLSLGNVINQLVKDAMGDPKSHGFLDVMQQYISKYYRLYDSSCSEERKISQKQLFSIQKQKLSSSLNTSTLKQDKFKKTNSDYIVKKFNALKNIEKMKRQMNQKGSQQVRIKSVDNFSQALFKMIKEFNKISYKRNNTTQIIYKYGYIIYRILSQAKVLLFLMENAADQSKKNQEESESESTNLKPLISNPIQNAIGGIFIELVRHLKDFMGQGYNYQNYKNIGIERLQQIYVKTVNLNGKEYQELTVNQNLISFFNESVMVSEGVPQKTQQLLVKYSVDILKQNQDKLQTSSLEQIYRLIPRLTEARGSRIELYELCQNQSPDKSSHLIKIVKYTQILGKVLQLVQEYRLARKVYETIEYVQSICQIFKLQIAKHKQNPFNLRVQYGKYLAQHAREQSAEIEFQRARQLASTIEEMRQIKIIQKELLCNQKDKHYNSNYEKHVFDQEFFFETFDKELQNQLLNLNAPPNNHQNLNGNH